MRTWLVIYKERGQTKTKVIMANDFNEVVADICKYLVFEDVKGVFEVAR